MATGAFAAQVMAVRGGAEVLSLDVFDTALLRVVAHPHDVFTLVGLRAANLGVPWSPEQFRRARVAAEKQARSEQRAAGGIGEVTLAQIYGQLGRMLDMGDEPRCLQQVEALELSLELEVCRADLEILQLYNDWQAGASPVVFTSDMYLPDATVAAMLAHCGYGGQHALLVSGSLGASKHHGNLFEVLVQRHGVAREKVLHVGDNEHADVINARRAGLVAVHYRRERVRTDGPAPSSPTLLRSVRAGLAAARQQAEPRTPGSLLDALGYDVAGPIYWAVGAWLRQQLSETSSEHAFFLSREGGLMQRLYQGTGTSGVASTYLYGSRRTLHLASLESLDEQALSVLSAGRGALPAGVFLRGLGVPAADMDAVLRRGGFSSAQEPVHGRAGRQRLVDVLRHCAPLILEEAARQRAVVERYFGDVGLLRCRTLAWVDIGWNASMQRYLRRVLDIFGVQPEVHGFYLATLEPARAAQGPKDRVTALLCNFAAPASLYAVVVQSIELLELMFAAEHGSVLGYRQDGERVAPILAPHALDTPEAMAAAALQGTGLQFVDAMQRLLGEAALPCEPAVIVEDLARLMGRPSRLEVEVLGALRHNDGLDHDTAGFLPWVPPMDASTALRSPALFVQQLRRAYWKAGYLTQVFGHHLYTTAWFPPMRAALSRQSDSRVARALRRLADRLTVPR